MPIAKKGFSLVEVLVFITVMSIFFVTAAAVVTVVLRNLKMSEQRILATRRADELIEWLRSEKDTDWSVFSQRSSASGTLYCFESLSWTTGGTCPFTLDDLYKREAVLTSVASSEGQPYQVTVDVTIEWYVGNRLENVTVNTLYSVWER